MWKVQDKKLMEFRDLRSQYEQNREQIDDAVFKVLHQASFIGGAPVSDLEQQLAEYVGVKHCISCANGTDALQLVLMAWGIGKGDAVFVPDFTFFSTAEVVSLCGATPIFVDVDTATFNMSVSSLETAIEYVLNNTTLTPKVIIPVDLFGLPADFQEIEPIAYRYKLRVLEDGAQGFGGSIKEKKACGFGDAATTSFFPAKPLGCYGDGGAIFTNDGEMNEILRSLKVHGKGQDKYDNIRIGLNSRLDTIQAAILSVKLQIFRDFELDRVNRAAQWYGECLQDVKQLQLPMVPEGRYSSWAQYTVVFPDENSRNEMQKFLKEQDVPSMIYYRKPLHCQKAFADQSIRTECPTTDELCRRVLSLPIHPYIKKYEVERVCELLKGRLNEINTV